MIALINDVRERVGSLASRVWPDLDEVLFNRRRDRVMRSAITAGGYDAALADVSPLLVGGPPHLVVVPQVGPDDPTWQAAGGNFFYEIAQSAREYYGIDRVSVFGVSGGMDSATWHIALIRYLVESGATHVIVQVEADPNCDKQRYTWDILWSQLHPRWDGVFLGLVTDSYFTWITASARRLARMSDRFVLVDICMPMDGVLVPGRSEVGPVNMPVSNETFAVLDEACSGVSRDVDVSFIGTLYPYRVELLDRIRAHGASVAVNPHRSTPAGDYASTSVNRPSYLDYMKALAQSRITINFSQTNAGSGQQLKTRILEAAGMGCLVLTDDIDRTDRFWVPEQEYGFFADAADLPAVVDAWLSDRDRLERVRLAGQARARSINVSSLWGGVDDVLARRGLRPLRVAADSA